MGRFDGQVRSRNCNAVAMVTEYSWGQSPCCNVAYVLETASMQSPELLCRYRMKGVARYGLVLLWNEVVELLSQGTSMTSALQSVAVKTGLSKTAIKNAIHCLGQVRPLRP